MCAEVCNHIWSNIIDQLVLETCARRKLGKDTKFIREEYLLHFGNLVAFSSRASLGLARTHNFVSPSSLFRTFSWLLLWRLEAGGSRRTHGAAHRKEKFELLQLNFAVNTFYIFMANEWVIFINFISDFY